MANNKNELQELKLSKRDVEEAEDDDGGEVRHRTWYTFIIKAPFFFTGVWHWSFVPKRNVFNELIPLQLKQASNRIKGKICWNNPGQF